MERDENEINSVVNFLTHEIQVRRYWLCPNLPHQAQSNLRKVLRTTYQNYRWDPAHPHKDAKYRKIKMIKRNSEGTVAWKVKLALKPLGLHCPISKQLRIYVNPGISYFLMWKNTYLLSGEVFLKREKHGEKFDIYNNGGREWVRDDPIIQRERGFNCFDWNVNKATL